jgi:hypothetical protein
MDGVLVASSLERVCEPAVTTARLLAENDQLRAEVAGLQRENLELRQQAGYWQRMHARAIQRCDEVQQEVELLRGEIRQLKANLFGRKSEKQSSKGPLQRLGGSPGNGFPTPAPAWPATASSHSLTA